MPQLRLSNKLETKPQSNSPKATIYEIEEERKHSSKKWIWIFIGLLICGIGGAFIANYIISRHDTDAIVELTPDFINKLQKYTSFGEFNEGLAYVVNKAGKYGYINTKGEEVIPCQFDRANTFYEGMAAVAVGDKYKFIDYYGKDVFQVKEGEVERFSEGLAFVYLGDNSEYQTIRFAVIDNEGKIVFYGTCPTFFDGGIVELPFYENGMLYLPSESYKAVVYDTKGNKLKEIDWEERERIWKNNNAQLKYSIFMQTSGNPDILRWETYGLKDASGKVLIPAIYDHLSPSIGLQERKINVSNGVVLAVMVETSGLDGSGEEHCGFVDLKGHDTFTKEVRDLCAAAKKELEKFAEEEIAAAKAEEERLRREGPDWLQGAWRLPTIDEYGNDWGYTYHVFDHGNLRTYAAGVVFDFRYNYDNENDVVSIENGGTMQLNHIEQSLTGADGSKFEKVSDNTSFTPPTYSGTQSSSNQSVSQQSSTQRSSYKFYSEGNVLDYLKHRSFSHQGLVIGFSEGGVTVNGNYGGYAPIIRNYSENYASVQINLIPSGRIVFQVYPQEEKLIDNDGNVWRPR